MLNHDPSTGLLLYLILMEQLTFTFVLYLDSDISCRHAIGVAVYGLGHEALSHLDRSRSVSVVPLRGLEGSRADPPRDL